VPLAGTVASPAASWVNIDSNTNYEHSIQTLISDVHGVSAVAMSYNLIYGAWAGYGSDGSGVNSAWGLWYNTNCTSQANVSLSDHRWPRPISGSSIRVTPRGSHTYSMPKER